MVRPAFLVAILLVLLMPPAVSACTCVGESSTCDTNWKSGEVVFLGTVTAMVPKDTRFKVGEVEYSSARRNEVHFSITESFRGDMYDEVVIHTGAGGGDCGYPFIVGKTYLVYAYTHEDQLTTGICSSTAPEAIVSGVVRELRTVRDGRRPAVVFGTIGMGPRGAGYQDLVESKPLANIRVRAVGTTLDYSTTTDQTGAYSFQSLPSDTYRMEVDLPTGTSTWQRNMGKLLTVQIDENAVGCRADVFARPDGRISGEVLDAVGRRVAGFVTVRPADPKEAELASRRGGLPGYEMDDGTFRLWQLPPTRYVLLFYPKIAGQVRFNRGPALSEVIDVDFGQHIENFQFRVPVFDTP